MTFVITMPVLRLFGNHLINTSSAIDGDVGDAQRHAARDFINNSDKKISKVPKPTYQVAATHTDLGTG